MFASAILCYEAPSDLLMCLSALMKHSPGDMPIIVFDNSEKTKDIKRHVASKGDRVHYLSVGKNIGCTASRNHIYRYALEQWPDLEYLCIMDQDIEVLSGWYKDMLEVMEQHPDCGIVAWPQAFRYTTVYTGGLATEVASMCNFHRIKPLKEAEERWGGPFDERFFIHRFDSLICQRLNQLGWYTRLVMKYYKRGVVWEQQEGGIIHHHPHQGVRRNPECEVHIKHSKQLYSKLQKEERWGRWNPKTIGARPVAREKVTMGAKRRRRLRIPRQRKQVTSPRPPRHAPVKAIPRKQAAVAELEEASVSQPPVRGVANRQPPVPPRRRATLRDHLLARRKAKSK